MFRRKDIRLPALRKDDPLDNEQVATGKKKPLATYLTRFAFVIVGLVAWFATQSWIGARELEPGTIGDGFHVWLAGSTNYLEHHRGAADLLLVVSSAVIDLLGIFLLWRSIFTGAVTAHYATFLAQRMAPNCDRFLNRFVRAGDEKS